VVCYRNGDVFLIRQAKSRGCHLSYDAFLPDWMSSFGVGFLFSPPVVRNFRCLSQHWRISALSSPGKANVRPGRLCHRLSLCSSTSSRTVLSMFEPGTRDREALYLLYFLRYPALGDGAMYLSSFCPILVLLCRRIDRRIWLLSLESRENIAMCQ